jgi:hypothetical protein
MTMLGWEREAEKSSLDDKKRIVREIFKQWPALLVLDDVDSLDDSSDDAIEFMSQLAYQRCAQVLMTSRRTLLGLGQSATVVQGLSSADANEFIDSRFEKYGLDTAAITAGRRQRIIEATEASPLYMEDLLRLIASGANVEQSIASWRSQGGRAARLYALGRELDMLGGDAREVLVAAAIPDQAVSLDELRRVTGRSVEDIQSAIGELRRLFLVPQARLVDGVERLALDANTRSLVLEWAAREMSTSSTRIGSAWRSVVRSSRRARRHGDDAALIRRASALLEDGNLSEAERTLLAGLDEDQNRGALHAQLGRAYASWEPVRSTDARLHFQRAVDLGFDDLVLFRDWIGMEMKLGEYGKASKLGRIGLGSHPNDIEIRLALAESSWRLGRLGGPDGIGELRSAVDTLMPITSDKPAIHTSLSARERAYNVAAYVLADIIKGLEAQARRYAALSRDPADVLEGDGQQPDPASAERVRLRQILNRWHREFPSDQQAAVAGRLRKLTRATSTRQH